MDDENQPKHNALKNIAAEQMAEWVKRIKELEDISRMQPFSNYRKPTPKYHEIWAEVNDVPS